LKICSTRVRRNDLPHRFLARTIIFYCKMRVIKMPGLVTII